MEDGNGNTLWERCAQQAAVPLQGNRRRMRVSIRWKGRAPAPHNSQLRNATSPVSLTLVHPELLLGPISSHSAHWSSIWTCSHACWVLHRSSIDNTVRTPQELVDVILLTGRTTAGITRHAKSSNLLCHRHTYAYSTAIKRHGMESLISLPVSPTTRKSIYKSVRQRHTDDYAALILFPICA